MSSRQRHHAIALLLACALASTGVAGQTTQARCKESSNVGEDGDATLAEPWRAVSALDAAFGDLQERFASECARLGSRIRQTMAMTAMGLRGGIDSLHRAAQIVAVQIAGLRETLAAAARAVSASARQSVAIFDQAYQLAHTAIGGAAARLRERAGYAAGVVAIEVNIIVARLAAGDLR